MGRGDVAGSQGARNGSRCKPRYRSTRARRREGWRCGFMVPVLASRTVQAAHEPQPKLRLQSAGMPENRPALFLDRYPHPLSGSCLRSRHARTRALPLNRLPTPRSPIPNPEPEIRHARARAAGRPEFRAPTRAASRRLESRRSAPGHVPGNDWRDRSKYTYESPYHAHPSCPNH